MASWLGWNFVSTSPSQCWDFVWFEPVQVLCLLPQPLSSHQSGVSGTTTPGSYGLPTSSFSQIQGPCWEGLDIPFMTECSKLSHSMHVVQLWVSVLSTVYCKNELPDEYRGALWSVGIAIRR